MASDFIGGGLPPSAAAHTDSSPATITTGETPAPITTLEPPASNPGSDDPTGGIAKDAGGVSSTAHIGSPATEEKTTIVGSVIEGVFGKKERSADEHESPATATTTTTATTDNTATVASTTGSEQATGTGAAGVLGSMAGAAAAGTAAVASYVGLSNTQTTPQEQGERTAAATEKNVAETQALASEKVAEATEATKETAAQASETANEKTAEAKEADKETKTDDIDVHDESEAKKKADHIAATRENVDAIPVAGGEKLGTAHEGESQVIPEVPSKTAEADETKPGQPDPTTAENTAKNAGEAPLPAAAPKKRLSILGSKRDGSESTGKPKFFDRIKAKLQKDKKEKA